ncbi:hypothetical protein LINPERPRIM_LOCUS27842, partial [Linum perenne]
ISFLHEEPPQFHIPQEEQIGRKGRLNVLFVWRGLSKANGAGCFAVVDKFFIADSWIPGW